MDNQKQPFQLELTQQQAVQGDGKKTSFFVKIILALAVIGGAIASLPFVFCGFVLLTIWAGPFALGSGIIGVVILFFGAFKIIKKIFKKK